jgi:hypothetical protein
MFESVPSRFLSIECIYMYSILDFVAINDGNLIQMLKPLETLGSAHVLKCEVRMLILLKLLFTFRSVFSADFFARYACVPIR